MVVEYRISCTMIGKLVSTLLDDNVLEIWIWKKQSWSWKKCTRWWQLTDLVMMKFLVLIGSELHITGFHWQLKSGLGGFVLLFSLLFIYFFRLLLWWCILSILCTWGAPLFVSRFLLHLYYKINFPFLVGSENTLKWGFGYYCFNGVLLFYFLETHGLRWREMQLQSCSCISLCKEDGWRNNWEDVNLRINALLWIIFGWLLKGERWRKLESGRSFVICFYLYLVKK